MSQYRISFGDIVIPQHTKDRMAALLDTNRLTEGPAVREFEKRWGELFQYPYSVALPSGTAADTLACMSLYDFGAQRGDEIIVPALGFIAVGASVLHAGFKPVFVDVDRKSLNIDTNRIEAAITPRTRAIMPVHTMGKPAKLDEIVDIAKDHDLKVIEDACEAHGATYKGKFVGNWGDMSTFSYYAAHLIFASEGGMVSTRHPEIDYVLRSLKSHGREPGQIAFDHQRIGMNGRMTDMQAVVALGQVDDFWQIFNKRRGNLIYLLDQTKDLADRAQFNMEEEGETACPHAFSVILGKDEKTTAKDLHDYLNSRGIQAKYTFKSMPTQQRAFAFMGHKLGEFPEAEYVGDKGVHFGIHQYLTNPDLDYASEVLHDFFKDKNE